MKLRLVHVDQINFQSSEATNIEWVMKKLKLTLGDHEAALLFSLTFEQCVFVRRPREIELRPGSKGKLYVSTKFRLVDGPHWAQNVHAFFEAIEEAGLEVTGLRTRVMDFMAGLGKIPERHVRATA